MKLSEWQQYGASPEAVWGMLVDPAFRADVCKQTGATSWDVQIDADHDGGTVSVTRVLPVEVSAAVKKLVGGALTVRQRETWGTPGSDGARSAEIHVSVEGQPARMQGTSTIAESDGGTVLTVSGDIRVTIPLLGAKLEKDLARAVSAGLRAEHRVGTRYLA